MEITIRPFLHSKLFAELKTQTIVGFSFLFWSVSYAFIRSAGVEHGLLELSLLVCGIVTAIILKQYFNSTNIAPDTSWTGSAQTQSTGGYIPSFAVAATVLLIMGQTTVITRFISEDLTVLASQQTISLTNAR